MIFKTDNPQQLAKRMLFLAYEASGEPLGMGVFQARDGVTEENVWENCNTSGDYPGHYTPEGMVRGDYVFGRMMKIRIVFDEKGLQLSENKLQWDYQAWSTKYKSYEALAKAAEASLLRSNYVEL